MRNGAALGAIMREVLDTYVEQAEDLTRWERDNPALRARCIGRPALVAVLREQAGQPSEQAGETWSMMLAKYKNPGALTACMQYMVHIEGEEFPQGALDVGPLGNQIYAGNGSLATMNYAANIADVPGVREALLEDIACIQQANGQL